MVDTVGDPDGVLVVGDTVGEQLASAPPLLTWLAARRITHVSWMCFGVATKWPPLSPPVIAAGHVGQWRPGQRKWVAGRQGKWLAVPQPQGTVGVVAFVRRSQRSTARQGLEQGLGV